jgi:hypothetical protein
VDVPCIVPVQSDLTGPAIELVKPELRPNPQKSLAVAPNGPDRVVMQRVRIAGLLSVVDEWERFPEEPADSVLRTQPHHSFRIFEDYFDRVVMQAVRIRELLAIPHDPPALTVDSQ